MRSDPIQGRFLTFPKTNVKGESYYEDHFRLPSAKLLTTRGKWLLVIPGTFIGIVVGLSVAVTLSILAFAMIEQ